MSDLFNDNSAAQKFPKAVSVDGVSFDKYIVTDEFVFFVNPMESDENSSTRMYNHNMELISDNYFASNELAETVDEGQDSILWVSENAKYNMQQEGVWPEQNRLSL